MGLKKPRKGKFEKPVDLLVEEISAYGMTMESLPGSTAGCLTFNGQTADLLPAGWILST